MIVQSFGALQAMAAPPPGYGGYWPVATALGLYGETRTYARLYAEQPNIRTCVDFLARNIAQLPVNAYRRVSDTDRVRLPDHPVVQWLDHPNPSTTRYRFIESLIGDLGIYFNAYVVKVRGAGGLTGLARIPPNEVVVFGGLIPETFRWTTYDGHIRDFAPSEIVFFNGYNPLNPLMGLSPLETLRRILAEEAAAGLHREKYWLNSTRMEGVIERTKDAPNWSQEQQAAFREQWQEFTGGGAKAGMIPVLPRGMSLKPVSFSMRDSEYLAARKLTREECASAYHIPLPMVGILDHATFSNIKEQHKQLYADCLGPWLEMLQEELERQLLPESTDTDRVYLEFNIADKLKGSFEEQSASLQIAIGRPFMTPNEGRARLNLPSIKDDPSADQLAPQQGGPAASADTGAADAGLKAFGDPVLTILTATRARQHDRLQRLPPSERAGAFFRDLPRWNRELAADLAPLAGDAATSLAWQANVETFRQLDAAEGQLQ